MTLSEALDYLRPHPLTKGPITLQSQKAREALAVIEVALPGPRAAGGLCPFNDEGADDLPDDFGPNDPCPICGDLGVFTAENMDRPSRCISR